MSKAAQAAQKAEEVLLARMQFKQISGDLCDDPSLSYINIYPVELGVTIRYLILSSHNPFD